jgi:hypothetical protein
MGSVTLNAAQRVAVRTRAAALGRNAPMSYLPVEAAERVRSRSAYAEADVVQFGFQWTSTRCAPVPDQFSRSTGFQATSETYQMRPSTTRQPSIRVERSTE